MRAADVCVPFVTQILHLLAVNILQPSVKYKTLSCSDMDGAFRRCQIPTQTVAQCNPHRNNIQYMEKIKTKTFR